MSKKYSYIKIRLASPEEILSWSHGEVKKHETINYRTLKPEPDGLFCEKIFGPTKDYQCACGKSKRNIDKGKICEKCGVEITEAKVRRERMGHITLAAPVVHTWYLRNSPSRLATLLDIKAKDLEQVVYLCAYIVTDVKKDSNGKSLVPEITKKKILPEIEYAELSEKYPNKFTALTGAEAVKKLLQDLSLYYVVEPDYAPVYKNQTLTEEEYKNYKEKYPNFKAITGLEKVVIKERRKLKTNSKQKREKAIRRLEVAEAFLYSDSKPEWMVLEVLPVIPPDLRPMVQLDGGRFATTDLNDLYRRILNRNNRLKKHYEGFAIDLITKNEKRMLQEAVDALIDNSKHGKKSAADAKGHLKSLSDLLRGKQGRFRQNLLGKRVDYSGRSVIVVGPDLKMYQCGLPREMALILFKPFVIRELVKDGIPISSAKRVIERQEEKVWDILEGVVAEHPILLNRAPTLHRLGIQAFEPKLIEGKAIRLHPLVCTAFNADFDGDQMAVHVPLSHEAQAEARLLMLASNNILNPKDGKPVVTPSQDMVLGNYYLTMEKAFEENEGSFYTGYNEAYMAYKNGYITLHTRIFVDPNSFENAENKFTEDQRNKYLQTTVGKMIFNSILPPSFPYINEPCEKAVLDYTNDVHFMAKGTDYHKFLAEKEEVHAFNKKCLATIIAKVFKDLQVTETSKMLDRLKDLGFYYSTVAGITISVNDVKEYSLKNQKLDEAEASVKQIDKLYNRGLMTTRERKQRVVKVWQDVRDDIEKGLWDEFKKNKENHIFMMADSGSRGSSSNFAQLAGIRGLMNNTKGEAIEVPVKSNFLEGLSVSEFFISTHGSRKGSTDTALKTAESGYLTRRLVDVSQDVIVTSDDCGTNKGVIVSALMNESTGKAIVSLYDRIVGRYVAKDIYDPNTGELIISATEPQNEEDLAGEIVEISQYNASQAAKTKYAGYISNKIAEKIVNAGITEVCVRSNLTCNCRSGVCVKCYGRNLATNKIVEVGEAVGTVAAQSIGEPGTQLTMRTFHTGGVASTSDITQGLPRVQELFEARNPKGRAVISEYDGIVSAINNVRNGYHEIVVKKENGEEMSYLVEPTAKILVSAPRGKEPGSVVKAGQKLIAGSINPKELLRVSDTETVQKYIIDEVKKVYAATNVDISDKHIEIIVRQMMRKVLVITEGDTRLLPGSLVSIPDFYDANKEALLAGGELAVGKAVLQGITKASLSSDSFLSAASFQETTRILTDSAIHGKRDNLLGLKENVIVGGLIPAGTGILQEEDFECPHAPVVEEDEYSEDASNYDENKEEYDSMFEIGDVSYESDFDNITDDPNDTSNL